MNLTTLAWDNAAQVLEGFGGDQITLKVWKTGMPFFDALRLYGAIDLYIGVREDVTVTDDGSAWVVTGRSRIGEDDERARAAFRMNWKNKKPTSAEFCSDLRASLVDGKPLVTAFSVAAKGDWDAALQTGIRGISAYEYETLQSGQTSKNECKVFVPLSDAMLAYVGRRRIERLGDILFLPIFEGTIDLSKVINPLRSRVGLPNVLCAQALALLMLKTSLFAEGYHKRLTAVAFNTNLGGNRSDNYSGMVAVNSTAIGRIESGSFTELLYRTLQELVRRGWQRQGQNFQTTDFTQHALAMAYWLLQPTAQHLTAMIGSQERLRAKGGASFLTSPEYVKEVFDMTYAPWSGDYEAVQKFARAVASAIYAARMEDAGAKLEKNTTAWREARNKAWYDEVTMLRSAPTAKAFRERALILIEQGHSENAFVGTDRNGEAYDPAALMSSIGDGDRLAFESFRDLFRMYLIQESKPRDRSRRADDTDIGGENDAEGEAE